MLLVPDNFAESDFDCLENYGASKGTRSSLFNRDSVLLKFDPLLNQPAVVQPEKRLAVTKEEDDYVADFELNFEPKQELILNDSKGSDKSSSANSTLSPNASVHEQSSRLNPAENEMSQCVDIMKDISVDNKISESNHIATEETKLR